MDLRNRLEKLANERSNPAVTISLNTHRTHPDNLKDEIELKNLVTEAKERLEAEYTDVDIKALKEKLDAINAKIDINHLKESLHIFLSKDTEEIMLSIWPTEKNAVYIDDHFAIKPLIIDYNRAAEYLILKLTQGGTHLYRAHNDQVTEEVVNHIFPFGENPNIAPTGIKRSDAEFMDDMVREHFRDIDKAVVDYIGSENKDLKVVVVTTEDNYSKLQQVATNPEIYMEFSSISHNDKATHQLAEQSWEVVKKHQSKARKDSLAEAKDAISSGKVLTDLQEIFQASLDGRGELLLVHQDFKQPVKMIDERTFTFGDDPKEQGFIDDITSDIAWKVISNGGKVMFTTNDELKELGDIALKTRY